MSNREKLVKDIYKEIENAKKTLKRKESNGVENEEIPKKTRRFEDKDAPTNIKEMMAKARLEIQQRKAELKQMNPQLLFAKVKEAEATNVEENQKSDSALLHSAATKAQKAAELQQRIQARLAAKPELLAGVNAGIKAKLFQMPNIKVTEEVTAPTPLFLDDLGRTVDSSGQLLNIPSRVPTLKANIRAKKREEFQQKLVEKPEVEVAGGSSFFDARVKQEGSGRSRRNFKFFEKGRFVQLAQKIRTKAQLEKLQGEIAQAAKRTGIQQASKLALIAPKSGEVGGDELVPDIEWWDDYVIKDTSEQDGEIEAELVIAEDVITALIEHPTQLKPPGPGRDNLVLGTYLTKQEKKKLRRMNRREALKDEQEKIRLGLVAPPEPKVKLSNLMRVLGNDAVQDPTKVEKHVRLQMAKRQRAHEQANSARKLTDEQRKEKKVKKLKEDTSGEVNIVMYRVKNLKDPSKKFKLEVNSKQLYMTGCTVLHPDINVVVVEGGPKAQRKFKRLMMVRLKWNEDKKGNRIEDDGDSNLCELIWEGQTHHRNFGEMTFKQCPTDEQAREFFQKHGVEHYWDLAHSQKLLEE